MLIIIYFALSLLFALSTLFIRSKGQVWFTGSCFYLIQAALAVMIIAGGEWEQTSALFFSFDALGTLFFVVMSIVSLFVFIHSADYLIGNELPRYRTYIDTLMLLLTAITLVYFTNKEATTWVSLEATTSVSGGTVLSQQIYVTL